MIKAEPIRVSPELLHARQALAKAQSELGQMRAALYELADGVVISDADGNLIDWNPAALRLHGYSSLEEVRRNVSKFETQFILSRLNGERLPLDQWPLFRLLRGESLDDYELRVQRVDIGREWIIRYSGAVIDAQGDQGPLLILYLHDLTEAREATAAQNETALRLRGVVETAVDGIVTLDESGLMESINPAMGAIFGYSSAELIGQPVGRLIPDWSEPEAFQQELQDSPLRQEVDGVSRDGRHVPLEVSIGQMRLAGRRIFTAIIRDITKRKDAERRLENTQSLLRTLAEAINDPVYIKDTRGRFIFVNEALAKLAGKSVAECIGVGAEEMFGPEVAKVSLAADQRVLQKDVAETYEESVLIGNRRRYYLITKCRFLNVDGTVGGLFGISRDITQLKLAEHALRSSARHVRNIMDSLPVIVMVLSVEQRLLEMNRTAERSLQAIGLAPSAAIEMSLDQLQWAGELVESQQELQSAVERATTGQLVQLNGLAIQRGGASRYFDITLAPMHDADGQTQHVLLCAVDISERKSFEQRTREHETKLAHLERLQTVGHMAAGLAHELNQPLGAIANYSAATRFAVKNNSATPQQIDAAFEKVISESLRAGEIIKRLRTFIKKQNPQLVVSDLNHLITESIGMLAFEMRHSGVKLTTKLAKEPLLVRVDPIQITQVLVNVLRNALEAMKNADASDRQLLVKSFRGGDGSFNIGVTDRGPGVSEGDLASLFDAFFTTKADGMGIGLALCRIIMENHGGQITAVRNRERGLTFELTLPASALRGD